MFIYFLVLIIALLYYYRAGSNSSKRNPKYLAWYLAYVAIFLGLGDMIGGYDRYIYGEGFDVIADETLGHRNYANVEFLTHGKEYGYFYWEIFCSYITPNRYVFILFHTLVMYVMFYKSLKDYMDNYPLACIVFLGLFYYFTMTYLRQTFACGIAWLGMRYLWQRDAKRYFLIVLLAYTFHSSAMILAPMYFIPIRKYSKSTVLWFMVACFLLGLTPLPIRVVAQAQESSDYGDQMQGFRIEYVIETLIFIYIFFRNYRVIPNTKKDLTFLNMAFVYLGILLVFMRFGQGGRIGWYYFIGLIYTLTSLANNRHAKGYSKEFILLICIALFSRLTIGWSGMNAPYKTFFTDGYPCGNRSIYDRFEYNKEYTNDKFCRPAFTFQDKNFTLFKD